MKQVKVDVEEMFEVEKGRSGGKMNAYRTLGRRFGRSASWVRRFLAGVETGLAFDVACQIRAAYIVHCEKVEKAAANTQKRAAFLRAEVEGIERRLDRGAG